MRLPTLIKKNNKKVEEIIVEILSSEWPLTAKQLYKKVISGNRKNVTYQAVFKAANELVKQKILNKEETNYSVNLDWIYHLEGFVDSTRTKYLIKEKLAGVANPQGVAELDFRTIDFVVKIGPKIKEYAKDAPTCIVAVSTDGTHFASGIKNYLIKEGINVPIIEVNKNADEIYKMDVRGKKIVVIDSAIFSGDRYRRIMKRLNSLKEKYKIKEIKYCVAYDIAGLADWSLSRPYS